MINLTNMNRQHSAIIQEVDTIEAEIKKREMINIAETALHINRLAGLLKMHLIEEDKYLYPDLLQCSDQEVKTMAQQYIQEMGDLAETYTSYKIEFHVSSKIKADFDRFLVETKRIMEALRNRMDKEDRQLYRIIEERKL